MYLKRMQSVEGNTIVLSGCMFEELEAIPESLIVHLGAWTMQLTVSIDEQWPKDIIGLALDGHHACTLPETLPFEVSLKGEDLYIGPVIAFIAFGSKEEMTLEALELYKSYYSEYRSIQGLVYICADRGVHIDSKTIEGCYYDPGTEDKNASWQAGVFPYPSAVFRRALLRPEIYADLRMTIGDRIFNSNYADEHFNKWEQWKRLSLDSQLIGHLPYTQPLESLEAVNEMLDQYGSVYLKPAVLNKAKGIVKVLKAGSVYKFIYPIRKKGRKACLIKKAGSPAEAEQILHRLQKKQAYIIQQAISMKRYEDRGIDFRVIMQKNEAQQWVCNGIIARFGKEGSIITNFTQAGYARTCHEAFQIAFQFSQEESSQQEQKMIDLCIGACRSFENSGGHYGDLGIDLMIDEYGKMWILEINTLHFHDFPLFSIQDSTMYSKVCTAPIKYAKSLAVSSWKRDMPGDGA